MNEEIRTTETGATSSGDSGEQRAEGARSESTGTAGDSAPAAKAAGTSGPAGGAATGETGPDGAPKKRRRRGKRGGRKHRKKPAADGESGSSGSDKPEGTKPDGAKPDAKPAAKPAGAPRAPRARSSGSGTGTPRPRRAPAAASADDGDSKDAPDATGDTEKSDDAAETTASGAPRRRRRGGRGRGGGSGGTAGGAKTEGPKAEGAKTTSRPKASKDDATPAGSTRLAARAQRRQQRGRRPRRQLSEEEAAELRGQEKTMLIHDHDDRTQIAVLEEGALIEHYVTRRGQRTAMAGNVFLGKVQNVLPGMEAAFIDFGRGRNGVLYAGEVNYSAEDIEGDTPRRIEHVLKSGQKLMVQVTKDPIGNKGARLTTQLSLAGRYLVLAPEQHLTGISRRLAEKERERLRKILKDIRPDGHGVIVRTAAEGATREALQRDLEHLVKEWEGIQKESKRAKAPSQLYSEPDLIQRVVRDEFSDDFIKLVVDSSAIYDDVKAYLESAAPDLLPKLELHTGSLPLFEEYRISEQLAKALERKVWLPSGGSLIIEKVEALTVIDVNTGKFTGKGSTLEETVFANNLEAAEEVARQLRLRDIGGIIVIDFIDMIEQKNQRELLRTFKRALSKDKTRSQVFEVSNLGLVEMTRKKVSEGLLDAFSEPCPNCEGRGIVLTHEID